MRGSSKDREEVQREYRRMEGALMQKSWTAVQCMLRKSRRQEGTGGLVALDI